MTRRHLYVISLWLPLMLLVLVSLSEVVLSQFLWHQLPPAAGYFILSGMLGGLQYLLFVAFVTWRFARMDTDFLYRISWVLPIMFFPLCITGLFVFFQLAEMHAMRDPLFTDMERVQQDILAFCLRLGMYSVVGGYVYVAITHAVAWALVRAGMLPDASVDKVLDEELTK